MVGVRVGQQHAVEVAHVGADQLLADVGSDVDQHGRHAAVAGALDQQRAAAAAVARIGRIAGAPPLPDARHAGGRAAAEDRGAEAHPRGPSAPMLREEAQRVDARRLGERLGRDSPRLGDHARGRGDEGRLVALAAMGDGREIGRVGLDQHPVERDVAGDVAQFLRLLEGHHAREGDRKAEVERGFGERPRRGEAVEKAA